MLLAAILALSTSAAGGPPVQGTPAVLFRCNGSDGVTYYMSRPVDGADCKAIYYVYQSGRVGITPSSILPECLDPSPDGSRSLTRPSARARECTRIRCAQAANIDAVKRYAMREQQSAQKQYIALACIMRKEQDSAAP